QLGGEAVRHRAVLAGAGADVAEDDEGRGPRLPALADVGAVRLLADGVQPLLAHQLLQPQVVGAARRAHLEPFRLARPDGDPLLSLRQVEGGLPLALDDPRVLPFRRVAVGSIARCGVPAHGTTPGAGPPV